MIWYNVIELKYIINKINIIYIEHVLYIIYIIFYIHIGIFADININ